MTDGRYQHIDRAVSPTTLVRSLRREALIYLLGTLGSSAFLYLSIPIYTRVFTPAEYGALAMMSAVAGVVSGILILGGDTALSRFWFRESDSSVRSRLSFTWIAFLATVAGTTCASLAFAGPAVSEYALEGIGGSALVWIALATIPIAQTSRLVSQVLRNEFRPWPFVMSAIALGLLTLALGVTLALGAGLGLVGVLLGALIAEAMVLGFRALVTRDIFRHGLDVSFVRPMVRFGAPLVPVTLSFWAFNAANRVLLGQLGDLAVLGFFSVASSVMAAFALLTGAVSQAWIPRVFGLFESDRSAASHQIGRFLTAYLFLLGLLAVTASVLAPELVGLVAAPEFAPAAEAVPVLAVGAVAFGAQLITASGLTLTNRTAMLAVLSVSAAVVDIAVAVVLIPIWGIMGAAIAGTFGYALLAVLYLTFSQRAWPVLLEAGWLTLAVISLVAAACAATILVEASLWTRMLILLAYLLACLPAWMRYLPVARFQRPR